MIRSQKRIRNFFSDVSLMAITGLQKSNESGEEIKEMRRQLVGERTGDDLEMPETLSLKSRVFL